MIVYFIQAHQHERQVLNLVEILLSCPQSFVMVSFDSRLPDLLRLDRPNYMARASAQQVHRGDFSMVAEYLGALRWLKEMGVNYDWFVNLSGQCLPVKPVAAIAEEIAACGFDAVMQHFPMLSPESDWSEAECATRLHYRYRKLIDRPLSKFERGALAPARLVNRVQPWLRINTSFGLQLGTRTRLPPGLKFFGGSYFKYLSRVCGEYLLEFLARHPAISDYFQHSLVPDEMFAQTILLNHSFRVSGDCKMFFRFTGGRGGHPLDLEVADLDHTAGFHFARKFRFGSPGYQAALGRLSTSA